MFVARLIYRINSLADAAYKGDWKAKDVPAQSWNEQLLLVLKCELEKPFEKQSAALVRWIADLNGAVIGQTDEMSKRLRSKFLPDYRWPPRR